MLIILNNLFAEDFPSEQAGLKTLWKYAAAGKLVARPAVSAGGVYLYSEDRHIHALTTRGELRWKFRISGKPADSLSIGSDGSVYACSNDGYFYAVNPAGRQIWMHELNGSPAGEPAASIDGTVYIALKSGELYAISHTGFIRWDIDTGSETESPPVIDAGEAIYTFGSGGNNQVLVSLGQYGLGI